MLSHRPKLTSLAVLHVVLLLGLLTIGCASTTGPGEQARGDVGAQCGSFDLPPCADGLDCIYPIEAQCGAADRPGTCQERPQACTREFDPVCGCDGKMYSNVCKAHSAGVSVAQRGPCPDADA